MKKILTILTLLIIMLSGCQDEERMKHEQNLNLLCENLNRGKIVEIYIKNDIIEVSGFKGRAIRHNSYVFKTASATYKMQRPYADKVTIYKHFNGYYNTLKCQIKG